MSKSRKENVWWKRARKNLKIIQFLQDKTIKIDNIIDINKIKDDFSQIPDGDKNYEKAKEGLKGINFPKKGDSSNESDGGYAKSSRRRWRWRRI